MKYTLPDYIPNPFLGYNRDNTSASEVNIEDDYNEEEFHETFDPNQ